MRYLPWTRKAKQLAIVGLVIDAMGVAFWLERATFFLTFPVLIGGGVLLLSSVVIDRRLISARH
jgi:hypothetical protein